MENKIIQNQGIEGKSVVITGATSGIGFATALRAAERGYFVIGVGRSKERNERATEEILNHNPRAKIDFILADLASLAQVRNLALAIQSKLSRYQLKGLDVLINNAGVYLERKEYSQDGYEKTFAVNHLAPFLLSHELLPLICASKKGRILTVSSYAHYTTPLTLCRIANPFPYFGLLAYKRSKLCNVLFTYQFNRVIKSSILAIAVDPGLVNTQIASKGSDGISDWVWRWRRKNGESPDVPAKAIEFFINAEEIDTSSGYYFRYSNPEIPSNRARNEQLAQDLWQLSCQLTNIDWGTNEKLR